MAGDNTIWYSEDSTIFFDPADSKVFKKIATMKNHVYSYHEGVITNGYIPKCTFVLFSKKPCFAPYKTVKITEW